MIYCPHCQKPSAGKSPDCPHCGGRLPRPKEKPRTEAYEKPNREDNKTRKQASRPNKGTEYSSTQRQDAPQTKEQPKEKAAVLKSAEALVGRMKKPEAQKPQKKRLRLGETLVAAGILTKEQVKAALEKQKTLGSRLGTILVQDNLISESQLVQALSHQADIRWIDITNIRVSDELLEIIPINLAQNYQFVPIDTRETKSGTKVLFLAMDNPLDSAAIKAAQAASEMRIEPLFAAPSAIKEAIRVAAEKHRTESESRGIEDTQQLEILNEEAGSEPGESSSPPEPIPSKLAAGPTNVTQRQIIMIAPKGQAPGQAKPAPKQEPHKAAEKEPEPEDAQPPKSVPPKRADEKRPASGEDKIPKGEKPRTLTFLDGTTIQRTVQIQKGFDNLTDISETLIADLKALDNNPESIPSVKAYLIAVLEILFRKKLIFPAELMDELEKYKKEAQK